MLILLLAADRVYLHAVSPRNAVSFYLTRFTFSLKKGSFVSVALSLGLPPVAVSDCPVLCCPDFPLVWLYRTSDHLAHCLPGIIPYNTSEEVCF